jgi:uncharacterized protein (UPF0248 family)
MDLRSLFNARKWHTGDLAVLSLVIRHRGAENDERRVSGAGILEINGAGLIIEARDAEGAPIDDGRAFIPYHRLLRVVGPEGVLYEKPS